MKKLTSLLLAGLLLLTSCRTENVVDPVTGETSKKPVLSFKAEDSAGETDKEAEAETEEIVTRTTHLTGIFKKEILPRQNHSYYKKTYPPEIDEDGNIRVFGQFGQVDERKNLLATINSEGEILNQIEVVKYNNNNIWQIAAYEDTVYYTQRTTEGGVGQLGAYITACGAHNTGKMLDLTGQFSDTSSYGFNMIALCTDGDGNVYLATEAEVAVLTPDLEMIFMLRPDGGISAMNRDRDGVMYIVSGEGDSYGLYPIDPEKKALGTPRLLGDLRIENLFFGDGYDFYYTDYETAVFGVNFPAEEGKTPRQTVVLNYNYSGVDHTAFHLLGVVDEETIIASDSFYNGNTGGPLLFRKAPDRPLEDIVVIEIAYTTSDYYFEADVMEFNNTYSNIMVVLQDYSRFNNAIEPDAGEKRLAMDVATGVYRPDIILGTYDQPVVKTVVDSGSFVNLMPYINADPIVSKDNIFPSVIYSYSTDDGKLWGLPLDFEVTTLVANDVLTGGASDWNFTEMMDFAASLPRDVSVMQNLTQSNAVSKLLGINAYAAFVDLSAGTCNFDTPEFTALLEFLRSLPTEERRGTEEEEYLARHNNQVALYPWHFSEVTDWLKLDAIYNSPAHTLIGYPVNDGSSDKGAQLAFTESYTMLSSCENRNEAWAVIRTLLSMDYAYREFRFVRNIPALIDRCTTMAKSAIANTIYTFDFGLGGTQASTYKNEEVREWALSAPMREPGIRMVPTGEMVDAFIEFLKNGVGQRITNRIPDEISKIVNEEIETYLTGVKNASECARIIQSRINIWLAEHE